MKTYYEKYWLNNAGTGLFDAPPVWKKKNLQYHEKFFRKYVGTNILDIGSGDGTFLNHIISDHPAYQSAVGLDISSESLAIGRKKYPNLTFVRGSITKLPFKDNSFDTIFAIEVLEHLFDIDRCISEIGRIAKYKAHLCITTTEFNLLKKLVIATFFWEKFFYPESPHIRFYTKSTLKKLLAKYGFKLVSYSWNKNYFGIMPKGQIAVYQKVKK